MTAIDPSALSAFRTGSVPAIDEAALPADVRKGTTAQKQTYQAALGFERRGQPSTLLPAEPACQLRPIGNAK